VQTIYLHYWFTIFFFFFVDFIFIEFFRDFMTSKTFQVASNEK